MPRGSEIITAQQAQWLEARANGNSPVEAAKIAGYKDPYNAAHRLRKNTALILINQMVGALHGVDISSIFETIGRNMDAKKLVKATYKGKITHEIWVDDGDLQLRAAQLAIELLGLRPAEEHKLVKDEEEEENNYMIPDGFEKLTTEEMLLNLQLRREALVSGRKMPPVVSAQASALATEPIETPEPGEE